MRARAEAEENNKAVVRRMVEAFNKADVRTIDKVVHPKFISRTPPHPGTKPNREGLKRQIKLLHTAFPDARYKIDELIADGDKVYLRWTMTAINKGPYMGMQPTGKRMTHYGQELLRFKGGKIVERHGQSDNIEFMQKLGLTPRGFLPKE